MIQNTTLQIQTRIWFSIVLAVSAVFISVSPCPGNVIVFDGVTALPSPIHIKVLTKGRFFAAGGRRVDIYLNDQHLKQILTGGDGYGYLKYIPEKPGFQKISARSSGVSASGLLLVLEPGEKAIVIEVEGAFKDAIFSEDLRANSQKVVRLISKEYTIIYLSRMVGKGISRSWLEKEGFPTSVILRWQGAGTFRSLSKKGVIPYAVIGSAAIMASAKKHIQHRYTFEESKDARRVSGWDEILKLLQPATPRDPPVDVPAGTYQWTDVRRRQILEVGVRNAEGRCQK